jgi:hypothetical protein
MRNPEKGVIPALRLALQHSSGELITRMDADDIMAPQKLERMHTLLVAHGPGHLSAGLVEYFADAELGEGYARYGVWINKVNLEGRQWEEIYRDCPIPAPCWLVYREDLLRAGAFEPDIKPEDYDLIFRFRQIGLQLQLVVAQAGQPPRQLLLLLIQPFQQRGQRFRLPMATPPQQHCDADHTGRQQPQQQKFHIAHAQHPYVLNVVKIRRYDTN